MGLPPESYEPRQRNDMVGSATDEMVRFTQQFIVSLVFTEAQVMERFKKRMRR